MTERARWWQWPVVLAPLAVLALLYFSGYLENPPSADPAATTTAERPLPRTLPQTLDEFGGAVSAELVELGQPEEIDRAGDLAVTDFNPNYVAITLTYSEVVDRGDASKDVVMIATAAVKALMAAGWNPRVERTVVEVQALQLGPKSLTDGETVTSLLGTARYDFGSDKIKFEAP